MAMQWASQQRQGWLSSFGTHVTRSVDALGQEFEKKSLDPTDYQWQLVQVLQDLLENKVDSQMAARQLACLILPYSEVHDPWENLWGCLFSAVEEFSDEADLTKLADLLACLAILNADSEIDFTGQSEEVQSSNNNDRRLANLPHFALNLRERMNGPEAYLSDGETSETAKYRWRNINTFTAIFTHAYANTIPALSYHLNFALWALANALEHDRRTKIGKNIELHLPAATQWILIAADEIQHVTEQHQYVSAGPLWEAFGGKDEFGKDRWHFWQHRFVTLAELGSLDDDTRSAAKKAGDKMATLTIE